jgi:hypothetical protein
MRNRYEIRGDIVIITLTRRGGKEPFEAVVSRRRLPKLLALDVRWYAKWHQESGSYRVVARLHDGRIIQLNRFITDAPDDMYVLFADGDTFNHVDENLIVTPYNSALVTRPGSVGTVGVKYDENKSAWYFVGLMHGRCRRVERYYPSAAEAEEALQKFNEYWI